jgi:hypothetical protein
VASAVAIRPQGKRLFSEFGRRAIWEISTIAKRRQLWATRGTVARPKWERPYGVKWCYDLRKEARMLSLLVLSLALSMPAATAQATGVSGNPQTAPAKPGGTALPKGFVIEEERSVRPFDDMEIHPGADICYKIRAYIFSQGRNPKLLRETTCGPITPSTKNTDGKPGLMPLDVKVEPGDPPDK